MSKEDRYYCARCGLDLTKNKFNCYASDIDRNLICLECFNKEKPKYLANKVADLEAKLVESKTLSQRLQSVIDNLRNKSFAGSTLVDAINNVYEPIYKVKFDECEELKQQLALTKTALELACDKLPMEYEYCSNRPERFNLQAEYGSDEPYWVEDGGCEFDSHENCLNCVVNYYIHKAKELKNETH